MLPSILRSRPGQELSVVCLGAHADDIEIGCGGTLFELLSVLTRVRVHWVVLSADGVRAQEARRSANRILRRAAERHVDIRAFRDGFLPYEGMAVKETFEQLKLVVNPDVVFTHYRDDRHQDHRLVSDLTWNTFRNHLILEYEVPKYDGDLGHPNCFVPLGASARRQKLSLLRTAFPSQAGKPWYSASTFDAMMRLRGIESGAPEGYAEAFYCRKQIVRPTSVPR